MQENSPTDAIDVTPGLELPNMSERHTVWMQKAIEAAREAESLGEVPVGAVIVDPDGELVAMASNRTIIDSDPTAHAEILALRAAAARERNYRLTGMTIYTTIEPCVMCAGALVNARIARLAFGARDERFGGVVSRFRLCDNEVLNHRME
ncbi:MAG TPA: nucleoside deaminase, partial [Pyrinomonadaceae bacterium]|nr:nucleoside deaminase [Pyrinomonadaceae bacterium]